MRVAMLGNLAHPASTENEMVRGLLANDVAVDAYQEGAADALALLTDRVGDYEYVFWTRTRDLAEKVGAAPQWKLGQRAAKKGVPIVGVHADLWFGLKRERELDEAYFKIVDLLCTADGGHQDEFAARGINHRWLLPAVDEQYCYLADPDEQYRSRLAFTGSWQGSYHREAQHRFDLVNWLDKHYGSDIVFYPRPDEHRVQRHDMNILVASVDVFVGDSCILPGMTHYCSDRLPTTLGRGGILFHPSIEGVTRHGEPFDVPSLVTWPMWDWSLLKGLIEATLNMPEDLRRIQRETGIEFIKERHTWTVRARELLDICKAAL